MHQMGLLQFQVELYRAMNSLFICITLRWWLFLSITALPTHKLDQTFLEPITHLIAGSGAPTHKFFLLQLVDVDVDGGLERLTDIHSRPAQWNKKFPMKEKQTGE